MNKRLQLFLESKQSSIQRFTQFSKSAPAVSDPLLPGEKEIKIYLCIYDHIYAYLSGTFNEGMIKKNDLMQLAFEIVTKNPQHNKFQIKYLQKRVQMVKQAINQVIQSKLMSENSACLHYYEQIAIKNQHLLKELDECKKFSNLTAQKMIKLDILSLFLIRVSQYRKKYNAENITIYYLRDICQIFSLPKSQATLYILAFNRIEQWLEFRYDKQYEDIITCSFFLQLKTKIVNYQRRYRYKNLNKQIINNDQPRDYQLLTSTEGLKFKFCEVAFLQSIRNGSIQTKWVKKKANIKFDFEKIKKLQAIEQQKQLLINASVKSSVSLALLCVQFDKLAQLQLENLTTLFEKQKKIENLLYLCQWMDILIHCNFVNQFRKLIQCQLTEYEFVSITESNSTAAKIYLMALQRLNLSRKVFNILQQIQGLQTIYIHRFDLSLNSLFDGKVPSLRSRQKYETDCVCSIVAAVDSQKPLFLGFSKTIFDDYLMVAFIKFILQKLGKNRFNLVFSEFDTTKPIERNTIYLLNNFFKRAQSSRVYVMNDFNLFITQKWLQYLLVSYLKHNEQAMKAKNFHQTIRRLIFAVWNRKFRFNKYYQPYYQKEESCEKGDASEGNVRSNEMKEQIFNYLYDLNLDKISDKNQRQISQIFNLFVNQSRFDCKGQQIRIKCSNKEHNVQIYCHDQSQENMTIFEQNEEHSTTVDSDSMSFFGKSYDVMVEEFIKVNKSKYLICSEKQMENILNNYHQKLIIQQTIKILDAKKILKQTARQLLVDQIYFDDIMNNQQSREKLKKQFPWEIAFLQKTFHNENVHINLLFPNQYEKILKKYVFLDLFAATKAKIKHWQSNNKQMYRQQVDIKQQHEIYEQSAEQDKQPLERMTKIQEK